MRWIQGNFWEIRLGENSDETTWITFWRILFAPIFVLVERDMYDSSFLLWLSYY